MLTELDKLLANFDDLSARAEKDADRAAADRIASITRMTGGEVEKMFPEQGDQKKLIELMQIVRSADGRNTKINKIVERAEDFSGIILKLLGAFV